MIAKTEMDFSWWTKITGPKLQQGDYLAKCLVPVLPGDFNPKSGVEIDLNLQERDLVVFTQSCDLEQSKAKFVALCPVYTLPQIEEANPKFKSGTEKEQIRRGRYEGLHMIAGFTGPQENKATLVVDFRELFSLPVSYLSAHADSLGERYRLQSPYLEHLAQSFARFFMRVGLPSGITPFSK
jgi:hypothetical protein